MRSPAFRWVERGVQQPMAQLVLASRAIEQWSNGTNRVRSSQWLTREKREAGSNGQSRWIPQCPPLQSPLGVGPGPVLFCLVFLPLRFHSSFTVAQEGSCPATGLPLIRQSVSAFIPHHPYRNVCRYAFRWSPPIHFVLHPPAVLSCLLRRISLHGGVRKCNRANEVTG